jgi:zinc transport system ATP-binding protein
MASDFPGPDRRAAERGRQASDDLHHEHPHHDHTHDHVSPEPNAAALISARGLSWQRYGRAIVQRVDLDIAPREIVTLIGPNGAGKTTLVRLMLGLIEPSSGTLLRKPGLVVGYVPQRFDLEPAIPMTVDRFLAIGGARRASARPQVLAEVGAPNLGERQFTQLSGGELQRVLIARALLRDPELLVLDEPIRGVDYAGEAELYGLITRLRAERGLSVLLVSHDLHVVMASSDRVVCINRHVCCYGVPHSVAQHPEYARLFGPQAARAFALYQHSHDHSHDLAGDALMPPTSPRRAPPEDTA